MATPVLRIQKKILTFIVIAILLIGGGVGLYFILKDEKTQQGTIDRNTAGTVEVTNTNSTYSPPVNMSPAELQQATLRDQKRLSDIRTLQSSLEQYNKEQKGYPEELRDLLPKYIEAIPGNPNPGGINYTYTPIGTKPYTLYDLSYGLEVGVEGIGPGMHTASPDGIATP